MRRSDSIVEQSFWKLICQAGYLLRIVFAAACVLLFLTIYGLFYVAPGSNGYYVSILNLAILSTLLVGIIVVLRKCGEYAEK